MATAQTTTKARAVQMPGEPVQPNPENGAPEGDGQDLTGETSADESEHPAVIALREMEAKMAAMQAQLDAAKAAPKAAAPVFDKTKPHLTDKGWFVPESHGAIAVKKG